MIFLFDKTEKFIGEIPRASLIQAPIQMEELKGIVQFEFSIRIADHERMAGAFYVAHRDLEEPDQIHMYKILTETNDEIAVHYNAIHCVFDDLKSYGYVRDKRPTGTASAALEVALAGSRWTVGLSDATPTRSTHFYDNTRLECISKIMETWGVEFSYHMGWSGNKITSRQVRIHNKRGQVTGKRFVYGMNALRVEREINHGEIYTAVAGRGKGEESYGADGEPTGGYGRKITFEDVVWTKASGKPVDKPLGQDYVEIPEMTALYGYPDGTPRVKIITYSDITEPAELLQKSYEDALLLSRPLVQFESTIRELGRVQLGDTVGIIRNDLNIVYLTRIFKVERNLWSPADSVIQLGDHIDHSQGRKNKELRQDIARTTNDIARISENTSDRVTSVVAQMQEAITNAMYNEAGHNYEITAGSAMSLQYGLPAGLYSFNKPIDQNPTKVIYVGAGMFAIANSKDSNGKWQWKTLGTGDGFVAEMLVAGILLGGEVKWNLNDGTLLIGKSPADYQLYWDGNTLKINGNMLVRNINLSGGVIQGKNITLDGDTNVLGTFKVSGAALFGAIDAQTINVTNLNASNLNRGTVGTSISNTSGSMMSDYKSANMSGSATGFNANSGTFNFNYGNNAFEVQGRINAFPSGNNHALELNGLYLSNSNGSASFKVWSGYNQIDGSQPLRIESQLQVESTLRLRGKDLSLGADGFVKWS